MTLRQIAASFASSAGEYDREAEFHSGLSLDLARFVQKCNVDIHTALEIGVHTGLQTRAMLAEIKGLERLVLSDIQADGFEYCRMLNLPLHHFLLADGSRLPLVGESFDLIYSGSTFQWFEDLEHTIKDLLTLLRPGGLLAFSIFISPSLSPLKGIFEAHGEGGRFQALFRESELREQLDPHELLAFGLRHQERAYPGWREAMNSLKKMGVTSSSQRLARMSSAKWRSIRAELDTNYANEVLVSLNAALVVIKKPLSPYVKSEEMR